MKRDGGAADTVPLLGLEQTAMVREP